MEYILQYLNNFARGRLTEPMFAPISKNINLELDLKIFFKFNIFLSYVPNKNIDKSIPSFKFSSHLILFLFIFCFFEIKIVIKNEIIFAKNILCFVFMNDFKFHKTFDIPCCLKGIGTLQYLFDYHKVYSKQIIICS